MERQDKFTDEYEPIAPKKKEIKISRGRRLHVYSFTVKYKDTSRDYYVEMLPIEYGPPENRKAVSYLVKVIDTPTDHQLVSYTFRPGVSLPDTFVGEKVAKHYLSMYLYR